MNDNIENIKVLVRIRPLKDPFQPKCILRIDDYNLQIVTEKRELKSFSYDFIADEDSEQSLIFEKGGKSICDYVLQGYNGTIFVYGQTGAGKTHTLLGPRYSSESEDKRIYSASDDGVLPRVINYLFDKIAYEIDNDISIFITFLEIYNEVLSDLLDPNNNKPINIREDENKQMVVDNITKIKINNSTEALNLLMKGSKNRHVASTGMNKESSRSHAVFSIYIENKSKMNDKLKIVKSAFHLIDLAGSERQKLTETVGVRLKEAGNINKSLMNLGHVINTILENNDGKSRYIHYRDSKLTYLLKDSLGGNAKTFLIANVNGYSNYSTETVSTLSFAQNAKLVKNKAHINEEMEDCKEENKILREKISFLEGLISKKNNNNTNNININLFNNSKLTEMEAQFNVSVKDNMAKDEKIKSLIYNTEVMKNKILSLEVVERERNDLVEKNQKLMNENKKLKLELREYVIVNANESEKVNEIERNFLEKEVSFKNEIENEKKNLIEAKHIIDQKDSLIFKLNNEIIDNTNLISHKDVTINNLKNQIQNYSKNIDDLQSIILSQKNEIFKLQQEITNLNNSCKNYEDIIRQKDLDMVDVKTKGKTLISQYNKKIESLNNKSQEMESSMTKQKKEINDLNLLLNEIKLEKNNLEEKYYKMNENVVKSMDQNNDLSNKIRLLEEEKQIFIKEISKLNEENNRLCSNENKTENKINYLQKIKTENNELKNRLNEAKLFDNFIKKLNLKNEKMSVTSVLKEIEGVQIELTKYKNLFTSLQKRILEVLNTHSILNADTLKICFSFSNEECKFEFLIDKLLQHLNNKTKLDEMRKEEIDSKNEKIVNLEKELLLRSENFFEKDNLSSLFSNKKITNKSKILGTLVNNDNILNSASKIKTEPNLLLSKRKYSQKFQENEKFLKDEDDNRRNNFIENAKSYIDIMKNSSQKFKNGS